MARRIAFWSWRLAGTGAKRASWNEIFRNDTGFSKEPNQLLVDTVAKVAPGAALDIAMGQGRNALYLASRGWKVTGVDLSDEGVRAAREAAAARHLQLHAINADLETYDLGVAKWELVTMIYAGPWQSPRRGREGPRQPAGEEGRERAGAREVVDHPDAPVLCLEDMQREEDRLPVVA